MHNPNQGQSSSNPPRGRGGRNLHIAHRRSPSELTPLMVEQLALQQQIEMLQAQQQQIMAQQQQFANAGLIPPSHLMPPPGSNQQPSSSPGSNLMPPPPMPSSGYMTSTGPFGQFSTGHRRAQSSTPGYDRHTPSPSQYGSGGGSGGGPTGGGAGGHGHSRRHSLALSEAKRAAALAQARRQGEKEEGGSPSGSGSQQSGTAATGASTGQASSQPIPAFKFPSSPDKSAAAGGSTGGSATSGPAPSYRGHGRSQSMQYSSRYNRNASPQRGFQFPPAPSDGGSGSGGGGGHSRTTSRNFDGNWRAPQDNNGMLSASPSHFVPGHRARGSYSNSMSSLSGYNMYPGGGGGGQGQPRKSLFAPYLPQASLPGLINEGRLVAGVLRVNRKNRSDAYVSTNGLLDADIFICGSKDRNRALEGDLVAVELLEVDEVWGSKKEKEEKKKRKDTSLEDSRDSTTGSASGASVGTSGSFSGSSGGDYYSSRSSDGELRRKGSLKQRPTQKKNDDVEVEGQSLLLVEEEEINDEVKPLYAGHIVAVIERIPGQMFSGTLGLLRPSSQATKDKQEAERREKGQPPATEKPVDRPKIVWFKPTDKRVPLIAIPTEQAPDDFVENHEQYADKIFVASIKRWPITSLHPFGTLVEELGPADNMEIEIEAILRDNNFTADVFPESVKRAVSTMKDTKAFASIDHDRRKDLSTETVTAFRAAGGYADLAVHVKKADDGSAIQLGIHIADVAHFVKPNSPLDREAKKRASSVFLKQRMLHLFPKDFNDGVSFEVDKVSPCISVLFELDPRTFEVVDTDIALATIKPGACMDYKDIEDAIKSSSPSDIISNIQEISRQFRKQRLELSEATEVPALGLLDLVDDERTQVTSNIFDTAESEQLMNELCIKANTAVAQKLHAVLGDKAFLRRHPEPILQRLESFSETVKLLNLDIDTSSAAALQKSLFAIKDKNVRQCIETLLWKCMLRARYIVAGKTEPEMYGHYYFNAPVYTHFSSPLRRYADVVVHHQIRSVICGSEYKEEVDTLSSCADYCNFKKDSAKNAQEQSVHLHLSQTIDGRSSSTGHIICDAIVLQTYESAFDVFIPEYGIEKRVHGDQLPLVKAEYRRKDALLELYWEKGVDSATFVPEDERNRPSYRQPSVRRTRPRASSAASAMAQMALSEGSSKTSTTDEGDGLKSYLKGVVTREEGGNCIQEIRILEHVPVLLQAELGKSIPCLTVRTLNPFAV